MDLSDLPRHATAVDQLAAAVRSGDRWRWLELGCSLATGRGDQHSDIDVAVGHELPHDRLVEAGTALVAAVGEPLDVLRHAEPDWPEGIVRFAAEYPSGIQLDLVLMPATHRPGLPPDTVALVDKDDRLAEPWIPEAHVADPDLTREWTMLGWWSLSNVAKYSRRGAWHEAIESLHEARTQMLRVHAAGRGVPYPAFGMTSLLDFPPFELPAGLDDTYATPTDAGPILVAATALADLLAAAAADAGATLDAELHTAWEDVARERLRAATTSEGATRGRAAGRPRSGEPHPARDVSENAEGRDGSRR